MDTNPDLFSLQIEPITKSHLSDAARWGKFLAICGFIVCALVIMMGIALPTSMGSALENQGVSGRHAGAFTAIMAFVYIIIAVIYFFPCLMLYRFSTRMRTALNSGSQETLNASFESLKSAFKFVGILMAIFIVIMAISILITVMASAAIQVTE